MRRAVLRQTATAAAGHFKMRTQYRTAAGTYMKNLLAPIGFGPTRETKTEAQLREDLPEIFDKRPEEIDDYIRPERTYFEQLEDLWDWVLSFLSPVDKQIEIMRSMHHGALGMDLSWGTIFLLWGCIMRMLSLPPMLYAQRNTLRMARCAKQTTEFQNQIKRVKSDKTMTTPERRVATEGYKRQEKAVYAKYKCRKYGSLIGGIMSPLMVSAFMAIRRLAAYEDDLESARFLWITDLTMPDPTMILPLTCSAMFLFNFERNQSLNRGGRSAMGLYMRWGVRTGALVSAWWFSSQPACLFTYWIGLSLIGSLQPLLLGSPAFRKYFDFPEPPKVAMDHKATTKYPQWMQSLPSFMRPELSTPKAAATPVKKTAVENIDDFDLILEDDSAAAAAAAPSVAFARNKSKSVATPT